jgi:hypothetical protein
MRARFLFGFVLILCIGLGQGAVLVFQCVETYSGYCADLGGLPGLLQETGFIPKGNCIPKKGQCGGECEVGNSGKRGKCIPAGGESDDRHFDSNGKNDRDDGDHQNDHDRECVCRQVPISR